MKKIELLAPAGNMKSFYAAVEAGADAIYLGGKKYGARAYSSNFSDEEIVKAINYAHLYNVKVYVTLNTIIYENEVKDFINYVDFLHKNRVDAVLIQDIGMLDLIRKTFPNLEVHASTQMHIHNLDGVKLMESLGVKRVVLARETSFNTIKYIKENSNIDLEVFIHGALCLSYSGCCLMSYFNGKRSGNRGECAGCCRLKYDVIKSKKIINDEEKYVLSTCDLNSLNNISKLIDLGVTSLKIEGRMKSASYVYLVVKLYKEAIDSYLKTNKVEINKEILHDLKIIFNRKYTKGFLFNDNIINMKQPNHQGLEVGKVIQCKNNNIRIKLSDKVYIGDSIRILSKSEDAIILNNFYINDKLVKEANKGDIINLKAHKDIDIESTVLKTSSKHIDDYIDNVIETHQRKVKLTCTITARVNEALKISITNGKVSAKKESIILEESKNRPTTKEELEEKINKLSDTIYEISHLKINIDDNVFVPMSLFNDLRREVLQELENKIINYDNNYVKESYYIDVPNFKKESNINILVDDKLPNSNKYKYIYSLKRIDNAILKLPRVMDSYDNLSGNYLIGELGALNKLKGVDSDFSLNVVNSYSVALLHSLGVNKITLSYELEFNQIKELIDNYEKRYHKHPNLEVIVYSYPEVMISKFDLNNYYNSNDLIIKNSNTYLIKSNDNYMSIYLDKLLEDNHNYFEIGINNIRENKEINDEYFRG